MGSFSNWYLSIRQTRFLCHAIRWALPGVMMGAMIGLMAGCQTADDCGGGSCGGVCSEPEVLTLAPDRHRIGIFFRDCDECPQMVVVPAGSFQMGDLLEPQMGGDDERPAHAVTLTQAFAIGRYEVTFEEWNSCVADGGCRGYRPDENGWGPRRRPVIEMSWDDAQAYVAWLTCKTGRQYRLPSETEWEYAARAGTMMPFSFEGELSSEKANYDARIVWNGSKPGTYLAQTMPVDRYDAWANAFGLSAVHGNVAEWTQDCYTKDYRGHLGDGAAREDAECEYRTLRGGSWDDGPWSLRSAWRQPVAPSERHNFVGFRVARRLDR